jgi:lactose/L-arabinose transport system ATP-binding protein
MRIEIARLHKELQTTIIYVTHDQVEAMTLADKIVVLREGVIEQTGKPLELYDDPANQFVAGFIGSPKMNFLPARVVETGNGSAIIELDGHAGVRLALPVAAAQAGEAVTLGVRPEHFGPPGAGGADLTLAIDVAEHLGSTSYVYARADGEPIIIEREESRSEERQDSITVSINPERAYLFDQRGQRLR